MKPRRLWITFFSIPPLLLGWLAWWSRDSALAVVIDLDQIAFFLFFAATLITAIALSISRSSRFLLSTGAVLSLLGILTVSWYRWGVVEQTEVRFHNGEIELRGTLCQPRGVSPSAAVVLVHGSGRVRREEHLYYARFLAERNISALAFDKRGSGESEGETYQADYLDYAGDVVAAVRCLIRNSPSELQHIGLVGFSEAEWTAPAAASRTDQIDFMVIVGGSGVSPLEQVLEEMIMRLERQGFSEQQVQEAIRIHKLYTDYIRGSVRPSELARELEVAITKPWFEPAGKLYSEVYPREDFAWWFSVMDFDVAPYWKRIEVPVLLIKGGSDDRSEATTSLQRFSQLITSSELETRIFPGSDHAILNWPLGERIPPPVFPQGYPEIIVRWIHSQSTKSLPQN